MSGVSVITSHIWLLLSIIMIIIVAGEINRRAECNLSNQEAEEAPDLMALLYPRTG